MKISVVIASYNGQRFIEEQIQTIIHQTMPVDEIIVSDDGSTDKTVDILRKMDDERIKILTGNSKHGYCGNFSYAMQHATGDYIFLADQDDIWVNNKVERVIDVFEKNREIGLVISNGYRIDAEGKRLSTPFLEHLSGRTGKLSKEKFLGLSIYGIANGMCLCLRKSFAEEILPFPDTRILHDVWICFCALNREVAYFLNEELVGYRIHGTNTSMRQNTGFIDRVKKNLRSVAQNPNDLFRLTRAMMGDMEKHEPIHAQTYAQLCDLNRSYSMQISALNMFPLWGAFTLIGQYLSDKNYRNNGLKYFALQIWLVLFERKYIHK